MLSKEEEDAIIFDIKFGDMSIDDLIEGQLNQRICNEIFNKYPEKNNYLIFKLPEEFITKEMYDTAFKKDISLIEYLLTKFITKKMYDISIKSFPWLIRCFSKKNERNI